MGLASFFIASRSVQFMIKGKTGVRSNTFHPANLCEPNGPKPQKLVLKLPRQASQFWFKIFDTGSPLVLNHMATSIEQRVELVMDFIKNLTDEGMQSVEVSAQAEEDWDAHVNAAE